MNTTIPTQHTNSSDCCGGECAVETKLATDESTAHEYQVIRPNVDIIEEKDRFIIHVETPGVAREDISVKYDDGELTIEACACREPTAGGRRFLNERVQGLFRRSFRVGERIDTQSVAAEYANGLLTIRLPKTEQSRSRSIEISAN